MATENGKLRVLFFPSWYPTDPTPITGIFIKEYAKAASLYQDVLVFYPYYSKKLEKYFIPDTKTTEEVKTIFIPLPNLLFLRYFFYFISSFFAFLWVKKDFKPQIIHAHVSSPAGITASILGKIFGLPVIISEHQGPFSIHMRTVFHRLLVKWAMKKAEIILPVSKSLENQIKSYNINAKFKVVPNIVDIHIFSLFSQESVGGIKKILIISQLVEQKGIDYFLESINKLIKKGRKDFKVDIIGEGEKKEEYKNLVKELEIQNFINFYSQKPKNELVKFIKECNFLVLPSRHETFGVVLIEAMACGKPVIATKCGGPEEIVTKETGILVPPKDSIALAEAINYMLDSYQKFSPKRIREYVKLNYSYAIISKKLDKIYKEIIYGY